MFFQVDIWYLLIGCYDVKKEKKEIYEIKSSSAGSISMEIRVLEFGTHLELVIT